MKMTIEILQKQIEMLNRNSVNEYALYRAYGKCQLVRKSENGGQEPITPFVSKSELSGMIMAIINYIVKER